MLLGSVFYWLVKIHKRHSAASNEVSHSVTSYRSLYCVSMYSNGIARTLKRLRTSKGDYWINKRFSLIVSLFKMRSSLKGKNLLS